jgi:hypothetical protein
MDGALKTESFVELRMNVPGAQSHDTGPIPHAGMTLHLTF